MRILTISDRVEPILYDSFEASLFADIDLILSCGDLPPEYLAFLTARLQAPLFFVKGNHDIRYDQKPPDGCINIHAKMVRFHDLKIVGLEGSRWYNGGPNQHTERQMKQIVRRLRMRLWWKGGIDMAIAHAPPRHVHDAEDRCHKGFNCFHTLINRHKPRFFVHGHIHTQFNDFKERVTQINQTKVINSYGHTVFEIDLP